LRNIHKYSKKKTINKADLIGGGFAPAFFAALLIGHAGASKPCDGPYEYPEYVESVYPKFSNENYAIHGTGLFHPP